MKTLEELKAIRDRMQNQMSARHMMEDGNIRVVVGMATCGIAAGARPVLNKLNEEVAARKLQHVTVTQTGCASSSPSSRYTCPVRKRLHIFT